MRSTFRATKGIAHITGYRETSIFKCRMNGRKINSGNSMQNFASFSQDCSILIEKSGS